MKAYGISAAICRLCIFTVPMRTCVASARRCGTAARRTSPCRKRPSPAMIKSPQCIVSFCWLTTGGSRRTSLTLSAASSLLLTHLIQHYSTVQWRLPTVTGGLAPGVKRHVLAWIDAHLDQPLTLADLAQQAGLSEFPFCSYVSSVAKYGSASVRHAAANGEGANT